MERVKVKADRLFFWPMWNPGDGLGLDGKGLDDVVGSKVGDRTLEEIGSIIEKMREEGSLPDYEVVRQIEFFITQGKEWIHQHDSQTQDKISIKKINGRYYIWKGNKRAISLFLLGEKDVEGILE